MGQRGRYGRRRKSGGLGEAIGDSIEIANRYSPKGTLIVGIVGFVFFFFVLPWGLTAWIDYNTAKLSSPSAGHFAKLIDTIISRRFIRPSEWVGIAILTGCSLLALWKALSGPAMDNRDTRQLSSISKLLARFLD